MMRDSQAYSAGDFNAPRSERTRGTCVNGRARLRQWFGRWCTPIRKWIVAKKHVPAAEADDLTQEVFLKLLRYSDDVLVENPQGYLFRVAANVVQDWRERARIRMPHDDIWLDALLVGSAEEPENSTARAIASRCLWAAVDRLPARQREILLLHVNEGMTYEQIAVARGLTYRIVLRDLTKAYGTLRLQLPSRDQLSHD